MTCSLPPAAIRLGGYPQVLPGFKVWSQETRCRQKAAALAQPQNRAGIPRIWKDTENSRNLVAIKWGEADKDIKADFEVWSWVN